MTPAKDAGSADHVGDGHGGLWDGHSDWRGAGEAMGTEEPHAALHPATKKIARPGAQASGSRVAESRETTHARHAPRAHSLQRAPSRGRRAREEAMGLVRRTAERPWSGGYTRSGCHARPCSSASRTTAACSKA